MKVFARKQPLTKDEVIKHHKDFNEKMKKKLPALIPDVLDDLMYLQYGYWDFLQPKKKIEKVFHTRWRIKRFNDAEPITGIIFTNRTGKPLKITSDVFIWGFMMDMKGKFARKEKSSFGPLREIIYLAERNGLITGLRKQNFTIDYLHSLLSCINPNEITYDSFKRTVYRACTDAKRTTKQQK